ncbi:MAG: hypothetical protein H7Y11_08085 [Armatimonadetes bacterium]|nr:hypothetical protein [Anaerolineae bacterium]
MNDQPTTLDPIPAAQARAILEAAIIARLGAAWDDEETGWARISGHDYMARLTRGSVNLDFYVDLLGNVSIEEKAINHAQSHGRMMAWLLLLGAVAVAYAIAELTGAI